MTLVPEFQVLVLSRLAALQISQRTFATLVGMDSTAVSKILLGKRRAPLPEIDRWATVLGVTASERQSFHLAAAMTHAPPLVLAYIRKLERRSKRK